MKICSALLLLLAVALTTHAQESGETEQSLSPSAIYIGVSSGLNNGLGIAGLQVGFMALPKLAFEIGGGIGTWGGKAQFNAQYHPSGIGGFYLKGGLSRAFGMDSLSSDFQTTTGETQEVTVAYRPVNNINLCLGKSYAFGDTKLHRFYFEMGVALRTQSFESRYAVLDHNVELSRGSEQTIRWLCPGGWVVACGLNFGL